MPSPQLAEALDFLHRNAVPLGASVAQRRLILDSRAQALPMLPGVAVTFASAHGVPAEWVSLDGLEVDRVMLFLHGGGYVAGTAAGSRDFVARLCKAAGARALSIDYRLAPEAPFPAGVQDCAAAYRYLIQQGVAPDRCTLVGPSAGGGLVAACLLALREGGDPLPACAAILSPYVDLTVSAPSLAENADRDIIGPVLLREFAGHYLQAGDPRQPLASPVFADLSGLPPLLIQTGTIEVLRDDARNLAERARACGVAVVYEEWEGMFHGWQSMAGMLPEGVEAIEHIGQFIRSHIPAQ